MPSWNRVILGVCLAGVVAVTLVACSSESPTATPAAPRNDVTSPPVTRDESNIGTSVTLKVGQELNLSLASNPSTGFQWALADPQPNPAIVQKTGNVHKPPATPIPGAGGTDVWTFKGIGNGQTVVTLKYYRSFDPPSTAPAKQVSFTVNVQ